MATMNIVDNSTPAVSFKDLTPGEVFRWGDYLFLRLSDTGAMCVDDANAVCLKDGITESFSDNDSVTRVKATLTIT